MMKNFKNAIPQITPFYGQSEITAVADYLKTGGYLTEYRITEKFEKRIASFLKVKYVSLVTSGTTALYLSLLASGLPKGSRVAVPDITDVATYDAVMGAGMQPVL